MTNIHATQSVGSTLPPPEARLRDAVQQLEGVFVEQLFKAMRATVPEEGITGGGAGEEMFTGLMDQHLAERVPGSWDRGLAEALTRQLQRRGGLDAPVAATTDATTDAAANAAASALPAAHTTEGIPR